MSALYLNRPAGRDKTGRIRYEGRERVGYAPRPGGGYVQTPGGQYSNLQEAYADEQRRKNVRPEEIPGAIASTTGPNGEPAVLIQETTQAPPRTIPERASMFPDLVASSRRGRDEFITKDGSRATLLTSSFGTEGSWGTTLKVQEAPSQKKVIPSYEPKQYPRTIRGVSERSADGYGYLAGWGESIQNRGKTIADRGKSEGNIGSALGGAQIWGGGAAIKGIGNVGQAYFANKAGKKTELGAGFSYGVDIVSPGAGKFLAARFGTPIVNRFAGKAIERFGAPAVARGTDILGAGAAGLSIYGTREVARASQTKEGSQALVGPVIVSGIALPFSNVQAAGFTGGALEGVFGAKTFGLKRTSVRRTKVGTTDQLGGAVGFGETGVPRGTLQATNTQRGTITYDFFGKKYRAPFESTRSYQLVPTEKGISTGKSYASFETINPITGKGVSARETFGAASQGRNLVEVSKSGLSGVETRVTYQRTIGRTGFGERIVETRGKTRNFERTVFGEVIPGRSSKRASVATETGVRQGSKVVLTPESRRSLGGLTGIESPDFTVYRQFDFVPGRGARTGSGVSGPISGNKARGSYAGIELAQQAGLVKNTRARGLNRSTRGSLGSDSIFEVVKPGSVSRSNGLPNYGTARLSGGGQIPSLAGIRLSGWGGAGSLAGTSLAGLSIKSGRGPRAVDTGTGQFLFVETGTSSSTRVSPVQRTSSISSQRLTTNPLTVTRMSTPSIPRGFFPATPTIAVPPPPPLLPFKFEPLFGGQRGRSASGKNSKTKRSNIYSTSLVGLTLGIRQRGKKKSTGFTGIEIRGL